MRILVLSFNYFPDLSPGAFRAKALVDQLEKARRACEVTVISTIPSRYDSYSKSVVLPRDSSTNIYRVFVPRNNKGFYGQVVQFLFYSFHVFKITRNERYDIVFATSSRLMTSFLGAIISHKKSAKLIVDVRDIFVETFSEVFVGFVARAIGLFLSKMESYVIGKAALVNLVSPGFLPYFQGRYPKTNFTTFTNGIDDVFIDHIPKKQSLQTNKDMTEVLYAGNIGNGQSLHKILPDLAKKTEGKLKFRIYGDGNLKKKLIDRLCELKTTNVEVFPPVHRSELIKLYESADVLFLHLGKQDAFKRVLPSKLFEFASLGKPIWAGVDGFAKQFIGENIPNASVFLPCEVEDALVALDRLSLTTIPRPLFCEQYSRKVIIKKMAKSIFDVFQEK